MIREPSPDSFLCLIYKRRMAKLEMDELDVIYAAIAASGFSEETLQKIDDLTNNILYGRKDFIGFTLSEHAGLCKGGAPLIGAAIVVSYARRSLTTGCNAESSEGSSPANWQIDEEQECLLEKWARATWTLTLNRLLSSCQDRCFSLNYKFF